jgi:hypothetical protein
LPGRVEDVCEGEVHVYGRDETIAAVRSAARPGVTVRGHGAGLGVAVVTEAADVAEATRGIADDVVLFDQRGCLSPRVVVVLGSEERGDALAAELASKLGELERRVPRGGLDADEVRQARRYVDAMTFAGRLRRTDGGAVVALAPEGAPLHVPPTGRHVHLAVAPDIDHARALLAPIASLVVTVGCDDPGTARGLFPAVSAVRWTWLGRMQRPPLDGPVDLRRV